MLKKYRFIFLIIFAVFLLVPVIIFSYRYFQQEPKDVLLEISSDKIISKYVFDEKIDNADNIASILSNNQKDLVSRSEHTYDDLDEYFDDIFKQYGIIEDLSGERQFGLAKNDLDDQRPANNQSVNNQNDLVLDEQTSRPLNNFNDLKILSRFDGENINEKNQELFEVEDKIALELDSEYEKNIKFDLETFINEKFSPKYERSYQDLAVENSKKFFTSPQPRKKKGNELDKLNELEIILNKEKYYRFEIVRANLIAKSRINLSDLDLTVTRGKYIIPNVGGKSDFFFRYKNKTIYANFALGYNPSPGEYVINVKSKSNPEWEGIKKPFQLLKRKVPPLQKGFSVVNWEYNGSLKFNIRGPYGNRGGAEQLIEWLKYMDVDAFWLLGAQTSGWYKYTTPTTPWVKSGLRNLGELGRLSKERDLLVGAYVMSYYTPANGKKLVGYNPSLGYNPKINKLEDSLHISLLDQKRLNHIIEVMKGFQADPNIDFVGLDFIRTGRADGYEMGPQVVEDMNIKTPPEYESYNTIQKIKWFARKVENLSNRREVTKWRWWRAHRVATIANTVIREAQLTKPLWVFTLGWNHGQQHGQDPYMFFDAGVFIDAIMLYEANRIQFRNMMIQWPNYMRDYQNNLVIGNASDVRFLDNKIGSYAAEYIFRSKKAFRKIYRDSYAKGLFLHDLSRVLWSSKRGYNVDDWALLHGYATSAFRQEKGLFPYKANIRFNRDLRTGTITIENITEKTISGLEVKPSYTTAWNVIKDNLPASLTLGPKEKKQFSFQADIREKFVDEEKLIGYYIDHPSYRRYFFLTFYTKRSPNDLTAYIK